MLATGGLGALGALLDMKTTDLEKVIYFQDYIVTDPGETPLQAKQLLTEEEYRRAVEEYGDTGFRALMGAEAVRELRATSGLCEMATEQEIADAKAGAIRCRLISLRR